MAQERYTDWKSPVKSKKLMEAQALVNGIGPQIGLNKVTVVSIGNDGKYELSLGSQVPGLYKDTYITDTANIVKPLAGCLVTPDGILTKFDEDITLPNVDIPLAYEFSDSDGKIYFEVAILASHLYVEDESLLVSTSFRTLVNKTANSIEAAIIPTNPYQYKTMQDWYSHPTLSVLTKSTEVIVGLVKLYRDTTNHEVINPYHYQWPQHKVIPNYMWDGLMKKVQDLEESLTEANRHKVQKGMYQHWSGSDLGFPDGYMFCGRYVIGTGLGDTLPGTIITKPDNSTTTYGEIQAELAIINDRYDTNYVISRYSLSNFMLYFINFSGVSINGVYINNLSGKFLVNSGFGVTSYLDVYFNGDTGGEVKHILSIEEMPKHDHDYYDLFSSSGDGYTYSNANQATGDARQGYKTSKAGSGYAHENRPPFFAMALLIKVI